MPPIFALRRKIHRGLMKPVVCYEAEILKVGSIDFEIANKFIVKNKMEVNEYA
jgi:hypothetical protein